MTIPDIGFNHDKTSHAEFEIFPLEEMYLKHQKNHDPTQPHRIEFFNLIYVSEGNGQHMVDFAHHEFGPGSVVFVQRNQVHAFDFSNHPKGMILIFTQAFLDEVHNNMRLPDYTPTHLSQYHTPILQLPASEAVNTHSLAKQLLIEYSRTHRSPLVLMHLFSALSLMLHRLRPRTPYEQLSKRQNELLAGFFDQLETSYCTTRDANWYADQLHTTYKTLNQVCKLATQRTAKQLIDAYTVTEIKRQLAISQYTVQQIAFNTGFDDNSNFIKYFRKHTGNTPTQFQQQYRAG
jgi:AraC-like DNA-binding protein